MRIEPDPIADLPVVFDFSEIPFDGFHQDEKTGEWIDEEDEDADNSVLADKPHHALKEDEGGRRQLQGLISQPARRALVKAVGPLRREIRRTGSNAAKWMRGRDVRAVNRALSRAGVIRWVPLGAFPLLAGYGFEKAVRKFQRRTPGLTADGVYGNATHRALGPYFDALAIKMYQDAKIGLSGPELRRQRFRSLALYLYHNRGRIHYTMSGWRMSIIRRRLVLGNLFRDGDLYEDCSSIGKGMMKVCGFPRDPNDFGWLSPLGYTGTMRNTGIGVAIQQSALKIADAIFTGHWPPYVHVWYYIGSGLGFSHGKESDPRIVPWNYRPVARVQRYLG